tara:strand:- start:55 stop:798 length:744 start_codon:yes stop_codon:yes gene_type:complete
MGYIGKKPTDAPLTSSDIADGIISTADLANTAVTGAKVNTDVISAQTALGVAPADTDEFLVSDAGVIKRIDYSLIKGGGLHTLLSTTTVSSAVSSVDITGIDTTYNRYYIRIDGVRPSVDDRHLYLRLGDASNFNTNGQDYSAINIKSDNSSVAFAAGADVDHMRMADEVHSASHANLCADVHLYNITSTSLDPQVSTETQYLRADVPSHTFMNGRIDEDDRNFDRVRFIFHTGNIAAGVFKLYGVA